MKLLYCELTSVHFLMQKGWSVIYWLAPLDGLRNVCRSLSISYGSNQWELTYIQACKDATARRSPLKIPSAWMS